MIHSVYDNPKNMNKNKLINLKKNLYLQPMDMN